MLVTAQNGIHESAVDSPPVKQGRHTTGASAAAVESLGAKTGALVPHFRDDLVTVYHGDCLDVMPLMEAGSLDAVVTDPPYHLTSIVKRFGKDGSAPAKPGSDGRFSRLSGGFMNQQWDGGDVAFRPETWAAALRLLRPGGHLIAMGGTRTYHRLVCAIEDAGFEIRDCLTWLYGSGFPKSHDVSKGLDRMAGAEREVIAVGKPVKRIIPGATQNATGSWIKDDGREYVPTETAPATDAARQWDGWGTALKPACELICLARKPLQGTVAQNVTKHGVGALNVDATRIATNATDESLVRPPVRQVKVGGGFSLGAGSQEEPIGRWPANVCLDEDAAAALDQLSGVLPPGVTGRRNHTGLFDPGTHDFWGGYGDSGGASRFFYTAKASTSERQGTSHPTVKPVSLMRWLCRMVTPPGGLILDPFAGSGTTRLAALAEGFRVVLIEREAAYLEQLCGRVAKMPLPGVA